MGKTKPLPCRKWDSRSSQVYGIDNLVADIRMNLGFEPNSFFRIAWKVLCPVIVISLMILSLANSDQLKYGDYVFPAWSIALGWSINMAFILPIPLVMVYAFIRYSDPKQSFRERLRLLFVPTVTKRRLKQELDNANEQLMSPPSSSPNVCV